MARDLLMIFFVLLEVFQIVYSVSGNDSFNPFSPKLELSANNLSDDKEFFQNNDDSLEAKAIEKRRLFFKEGEANPAMRGEREMELDNFSSRRRTNFSEIETEDQISEMQERPNNWDNRHSQFSVPVPNSQNIPELRSRHLWTGQHANQNFNWEQRNDVFEKSHSRLIEEKNFRQFENPEFHSRQANRFNGRSEDMYNDHEMNFNINPGRSGEVFNKRISITTLNEPKNYNEDRVEEMNPAYMSNLNKNYFNTNSKRFWNPNFYRPEKGVIINFNTECPAPRHFNNQLVHKFIYAQKPPINAAPEMPSFSVPESAVVSSYKMAPMYYL